MPRIIFAPSIQRHVPCDEQEVQARTVGAALQAVFDREPRLRGYILDDQGGLRRHLVVFVDGLRIRDRQQLSDPLDTNSEVYVVQALSGG
ncbi:hypothetical protein D3C76_946870 [compost metagenome]